MLDSVLNGSFSAIIKFVLCAITSVGAGFLTALIYKLYRKKGGFSSDMPASLVILPVIVMVVALVARLIGLESSDMRTTIGFSLAGIIAVMRFRSTPKDAVDLTFITVAIILGFLSGLGYLMYVIFTIAIMLIIVIVLHLTNFSLTSDKEMTLKVTIPEDLNFDHLLDDDLNQYCSKWNLKGVKSTDFGTLFELAYYVTIKDDNKQKEFIDKIREKNANLNVSLTVRNYDKI